MKSLLLSRVSWALSPPGASSGPTDESTGMTINNYAKAGKVDLIVVGTHGRSGLESWLLGSVAESVLSHAEVDVLAVPRSAAA